MMPADADNTTDTAAAEEAQAQADFDSGSEAAPAPPAAKPDTPAATKAVVDEKPAPAEKPSVPAAPTPKYVRVTEDQFAALTAAAAKTASYDAQFSRVFGTMGDLQKKLNGHAAAPGGRKFEIPKDAFAGMERDFPELAEHTRAALEATLRGITGNAGAAEIDPELMKRLITEHATQARVDAEIEALAEEYHDWRKIVGQVDISKEQPDANNPFRKWLATKDAAYQARLNSTNSTAVISRAISRFQSETKAPPAKVPDLKAQLQASRIAAAVRPRGDGGHAGAANTEDADFEAGFAGR